MFRAIALPNLKGKWGATSQPLVYMRFPGTTSLAEAEEWKLSVIKRVFAWMPDRLLKVTGKMIYRHIG